MPNPRLFISKYGRGPYGHPVVYQYRTMPNKPYIDTDLDNIRNMILSSDKSLLRLPPKYPNLTPDEIKLFEDVRKARLSELEK